MGRVQRDKDTAQDIVSMLRASMATLTNTRDGHPLHSYQFNEKAPGIRYAINLIEDAFQLEKKDK